MGEMTKSVAERVAVAKACGFDTSKSSDLICFISVTIDGPLGKPLQRYRQFDPFRIERDAVLAAEKFGLFNGKTHGKVLCRLAGEWVVTDLAAMLEAVQPTGSFFETHTFVRCDGRGTFCEAICSAILALSKEPSHAP